jgi:hypothetical protein
VLLLIYYKNCYFKQEFTDSWNKTKDSIYNLLPFQIPRIKIQ